MTSSCFLREIFHFQIFKNFQINLNSSNDLTESLYMSLKDFPSMAHHEMFKRNRPTAIYIHGALYYDPNYFSTVDIRGAYRHEGKHNFISVYWEQYSDCTPYNEGIRMLKYVSSDWTDRDENFPTQHIAGRWSSCATA